MEKRFYKKWWFWLITAIIIFLFFTSIVWWFINNKICLDSRIDGYKNTETGECEWLHSCREYKIPEEYIFDEECWHKAMPPIPKSNLTSLCEDWCNNCPEESLWFPICKASHKVVDEQGNIYFVKCSEVMN